MRRRPVRSAGIEAARLRNPRARARSGFRELIVGRSMRPADRRQPGRRVLEFVPELGARYGLCSSLSSCSSLVVVYRRVRAAAVGARWSTQPIGTIDRRRARLALRDQRRRHRRPAGHRCRSGSPSSCRRICGRFSCSGSSASSRSRATRRRCARCSRRSTAERRALLGCVVILIRPPR